MYFFDSRIRYSECDCEGKLTMASLLNYFQDCSTFQSEDLGVGFAYMNQIGMVWVLSYWQIVVERYPSLGERVKISTLPYEFKRFLGGRNFMMQTAEGEVLAKANSLWTLLDLKTGRPTAATEQMLEAFAVEERLDMEYAPRKVSLPSNGSKKDPILVQAHHLDTNHHVNNGQYVDMALQYMPEGCAIKQLRAEYRQQAFLGDIFTPYVAEAEGEITVAFLDGEGKPYAIIQCTPMEQ